MRRALRAINTAWAYWWDLSLFGMLGHLIDWIVDRTSPPLRKPPEGGPRS